MKTQIKKIILITAALVFVGSGVSFAQDWKDRGRNAPGKAYGHYQVKKQPPALVNKNFRPNAPITKRYVYKEVRDYRYHDGHYRRSAPRRTEVYKPPKKDPVVLVFKVILKELR